MPTRTLQGGCAVVLIAVGGAFAPVGCLSEESNRIERPHPSLDEGQALAAEIAKGDGLLRLGDIIVTPHGFLVFKGIAADAYTNQFEPVPNPLNQIGPGRTKPLGNAARR